mgnify:CR=1 FL=1
MGDLIFFLLLWLGLICVGFLVMARDQLESFFMPNRCVVIKYYSRTTGHSSIVIQTDDPSGLLAHITDVGAVNYLKKNYINSQNEIYVSLVYAKGTIFKPKRLWDKVLNKCFDFGKILINNPGFAMAAFSFFQSYFNQQQHQKEMRESEDILSNIRQRRPSTAEDKIDLTQYKYLFENGLIWQHTLTTLTDANKLSDDEFDKLKKRMESILKEINFDIATYEQLLEQTNIFFERYKRELNNSLRKEQPLEEVIAELAKKFPDDTHAELNKYLDFVMKYLMDDEGSLDDYSDDMIRAWISNVKNEANPIIYEKCRLYPI